VAIYGISQYGTDTYGAPTVAELRAAGFSARPQEFDKIFLSWSLPTGDWDRLLLIRSSYGFPTTLVDGLTLFDDTVAAARTSFLDGAPNTSPGPLQPGHFYYYTLFVHLPSTDTYQVVGNAQELVTQDFAMGDRLWSLLADVHRQRDSETPQIDQQGQLQRFLDLFGEQANRLRTETQTLLNAYNIDLVSGKLLPSLAKSLGVPYELELGQRISRSVLKNAVYMAKMKGTKPGVEAVASSYTGFGATVETGINLLLDYNDSAMKQSVGHWSATNAGLQRLADTSHAPPLDGSGSIQVAATGGIVNVNLGTFTNTTLIPVKALTAYAASVYVQTANTPRSVRLDVVWFDLDGRNISTTQGAATNDAMTWARRTAIGTSPTAASYALLRVVIIDPVASEIHYISSAQLEEGSAVTTFEPGRQVNIYLDPLRQNLVPNPSFEANTTGWTAGTASTIARSTAKHWRDTAALQLGRTGTTGTSMAFSTTGTGGVPAVAGDYYSASAYFLAGTISRSTQIGLMFYNSAGTFIGSTTFGTAVADNSATWVRASVTALAPVGTAFVAVTVQALAVPVGEAHYVDAVLLEQTEFVKDYFDAAFSPAGDYVWNGTAHASASSYYPRRTLKFLRLQAVLPRYLPTGLTFKVLYANGQVLGTGGDVGTPAAHGAGFSAGYGAGYGG
jgi:phage tail-like protein